MGPGVEERLLAWGGRASIFRPTFDHLMFPKQSAPNCTNLHLCFQKNFPRVTPPNHQNWEAPPRLLHSATAHRPTFSQLARPLLSRVLFLFNQCSTCLENAFTSSSLCMYGVCGLCSSPDLHQDSAAGPHWGTSVHRNLCPPHLQTLAMPLYGVF